MRTTFRTHILRERARGREERGKRALHGPGQLAVSHQREKEGAVWLKKYHSMSVTRVIAMVRRKNRTYRWARVCDT